MQRLRLLIDKAAKLCGGRSALARRLGVQRASVTRWASGATPCPIKHAAVIAQLAGSTAEAGVMAAVRPKLRNMRKVRACRPEGPS